MKLSICIATCQDFDSFVMTVQALKMYHPCKDAEFIVFDNGPDSPDGRETKKFVEGALRGKYFGFSSPQSSWNKYKTIPFADGDVLLGLDSHVLIQPGGIQKLLDYFAAHPQSKNLVQGQLLYDPLDSGPTKMGHRWGSGMLGVWEDSKPLLTNEEPFEIDNMGMGLWAIRKQAWKGVSPYFRGFGAEEYTIHQYIKSWGGKCIILPGMGFWHRFARCKPIPFKLRNEDKIFNYFVGALDVHKSELHPIYDEAREHFKSLGMKDQVIDDLYQEAKSLVLG